MLRRTHASPVLALATAAICALPLAAAPATWADAADATVHPGVQTFADGAQCTANFVFTGTDGTVYLGSAAHCTGIGAATDTDGCTSGSLPLGTPIEVTGAGHPGHLAYSSWLQMQADGETDADTCAYNDFALIALDSRDIGKVNPSMPFFGGPEGVGDATAFGETVYTYGNSSLRLGISTLSPKTGVSLGTQGGGWTHTIYTVSPGIPGDSGSGVLDSEGNAIGVLSTLALAPLAGSNNASDLGRALDYLNAHTGLGVTLARGTEAF